MADQEVIFRKAIITVIATLAGVGILATFLVEAISRPNESDFFGATVVSVFVYGFWLIGWQSAIRVEKDGLVVDNLLSRRWIPWRDISEIKAANGLVILTRSGDMVGSLMYGGSLIGVITGNRKARSVAEKIGRIRTEIVDSRDFGETRKNFRSGIHFRPLPPLMILVATEIVATVTFAMR